MSTKTVHVTLAVVRTNRYPYFAAHSVGPNSKAYPSALRVPIRLEIDAQLIDHRTDPVNVTVKAEATKAETP